MQFANHKKERSFWKNIGRKAKFFPFYLLAVLPFSVLYLLSDLLFLLFYYVLRYRRKVVFENIKKSFPHKNDREIREISKGYYKHLCDVIFESIKRLTISENTIKKRLKIVNPEMISSHLENQQGVLLYTAHQGNWEWLVFVPLFLPYPSNTFYRPVKNRYFDELFKLMRERFAVNLITEREGYKKILEGQGKSEFAMNCVIGDQSPSLHSAKHWATFLNRNTAFYLGAEQLAKKTGQAVIFPYFKKTGRGHYELEFKLLEERPQVLQDHSIIDQYAKELEAVIQDSPEQWLWSHRRWKLTRDSA